MYEEPSTSLIRLLNVDNVKTKSSFLPPLPPGIPTSGFLFIEIYVYYFIYFIINFNTR